MGSLVRNLQALHQLSRRTVSTSTRKSFQNRVPEKQKLFQEDNDIPVHIKGGIRDVLLYRVTMFIMLSGTCYGLYELGKASFPQKK